MEKFNRGSSQQPEIVKFSDGQRNGIVAPASTIRVFVVDNQPVFSAGIQAILERTTDLRIVGTTESLNMLSPSFPEKQPDVVLYSADTPDDCLFETLVIWKQKYEHCRILLIISRNAEVFLPELTAHGIEGCILKTDAAQRFVRAIRAVARGKVWFSRQLLQETVQSRLLSTPELLEVQLTEQEKNILQLICAENSNPDIAAELHVSERTVCRYLEEIYVKLGVSSRVGAAIKAVRMGLA